MVDIYLRSVPSDADSDDVRLYDPTTADAGGAITGASNVTLAGVTASATGALLIKGASSVTLGAVVAAATGALAIKGASAVTLDAITAVATGEISEAPAVDVPAIDVGGSQRVFRAMRRNEKRRKRREQDARERLRATLERAARAIYGEPDPQPEAVAAIADARDVLAGAALDRDAAVVSLRPTANQLTEISAAIRRLEAVMREIEDDEEAAVMMLLAA